MAFSRGCSQRNLQCFLDSVTPIAPSRTASRAEHVRSACPTLGKANNLYDHLMLSVNQRVGSCMRYRLIFSSVMQERWSRIHDINHLWQPAGKEMIEYFELQDLWNSYEEWSAFGVGTKVVLSNGQTVKQYYVPYLSAIQVYTNQSIVPTRTKAEGNVAVEFESDSWSDDSGSDKLSRCLSNNSSKGWDSSSEDSSSDQPVSWPMRDKFGSIYLEYFEACSPKWRIPLSNKITELTKDHPALTTLRSMDISPASWMAVAWYPIYHIPSSSNNKDLLTCFLTYHTLSSSFLDCTDDLYEDDECHPLYMDSKLKGVGSDQIPISPFGLATYKMRGDLWVKPGTHEHLKYTLLHNAAHSWVKQLNIYHHDLNFFSRDSIV